MKYIVIESPDLFTLPSKNSWKKPFKTNKEKEKWLKAIRIKLSLNSQEHLLSQKKLK